jgi:DNA-binding LytR/AlgR family response regulator
MRIAICDDDENFLRGFRDKLIACGDIVPNAEISVFPSGDELVSRCGRGNAFDLVFLDMEMPGMSGLETGQKIRELDKTVLIVFLTGFRQYVFESFQIEAFDYLIKPLGEGALISLLTRAFRKYKEQHYIVNLCWQDQVYALAVGEIVYIEGYHRHTVFYTARGKYECVGKLADYESVLFPYGFLRCHQGFLINMHYIKIIEDRHIVTITGATVDISARKKQECLQRFNEYLAGCKI